MALSDNIWAKILKQQTSPEKQLEQSSMLLHRVSAGIRRGNLTAEEAAAACTVGIYDFTGLIAPAMPFTFLSVPTVFTKVYDKGRDTESYSGIPVCHIVELTEKEYEQPLDKKFNTAFNRVIAQHQDVYSINDAIGERPLTDEQAATAANDSNEYTKTFPFQLISINEKGFTKPVITIYPNAQKLYQQESRRKQIQDQTMCKAAKLLLTNPELQLKKKINMTGLYDLENIL